MGKKRIVTQESKKVEAGEKSPDGVKSATRRHLDYGTLYIEATYNNTKGLLTDTKGNALTWTSSGALGFKGAKKGTPFAAAKVGETIGDRALNYGMKEVSVIVSGVGAGRESLIRGFISRGIALSAIKDVTPVTHNGPRPKKPRRV